MWAENSGNTRPQRRRLCFQHAFPQARVFVKEYLYLTNISPSYIDASADAGLDGNYQVNEADKDAAIMGLRWITDAANVELNLPHVT